MRFYAIGPLLVALSTLGFGFFTLLSNPKAKLNRLFFGLCVSVFVWALGYSQMYNTVGNDVSALMWARIGYIGVPFIPVFVYHFIITFLELKQFRWSIGLVYVLGFLFVALGRTDLFLSGMYDRYFWGYYPKAGPLYVTFVLFFACVFVRMVLLLYRELRRHVADQAPVKTERIKYVLVGFAIATTSLVDYVANYGVEIYPFAYLSAFGWLLCMGWASFKYRLMDVTLLLTRTAIFLTVYTLTIGFPMALVFLARPRLEGTLGKSWWIIPAGALGYAVLASLTPFIFYYFQRHAENRLLSEQRRYQATLRQASEGMTRIRQLPRLLKLTAGILSRAVGLTHVSIYLFESDSKEYVQQVTRGQDKRFSGGILELDNPLIRYLLVHKNAIVLEELHMLRQQSTNPGLHDVETALRRLGAALVVPSFVHDHLLGFVVMGAKRSGRIYTDDDLKVLMTLANQAALAIENARFYETEKERQAEMFHTAQLASLGTMAGSMSHQINNRFYVESVVAGAQRTLWQEVDLTGVPEHVRELAQKTIVAFQKIETDAIRGGDIAKTLLNFSKPGKMDRTAFPEIIKLAMDLAQYRVKFEEIDFESVVSNPSPPLEGNKNQLTEVFYNLMSNAYDAIKSKEQKVKEGQLTVLAGQGYKGRLAVSATSTAKNGAPWLQVVVHDNGIGVKQEDLTRLFIPFFTTKATAEKGTGLGLYVIKKIIENHGGKVEVNSAYGEGTTFTIHLPAAAGTA